ncbi:amino acid/polyamine/organocation transporter, APC superfamily [Pseudonocardia thermophila]|uniref:Amino acid/polyamine/organocation transporter, APC superfamily n=1 Tax=Pseudonocardia thermophila TaxID=1848 RepID=A0A1M6PFR0_PSETH|nr:APC family permease [Pseudonocardia thermophila]SHK06754.1 amino acid/polyamine/organocation transporter, APC superfamily [Pseudonocardia thermophila]
MGHTGSTESTGRRTLSGSLGVGSIVFMVVAAAAPLTVIAGTVPLGISLGNGPAFPITYALCSAILLLFAVGFCAMSRHVREAGAFYSYVERGLGRAPGLGTAFLALATYTAVQVALYGFIGDVIGETIVRLGGPALPWWLCAFATIAVVAFLGYRHIDLSGRVLSVLLCCEVAIVLVMDTVVVLTGGGTAAGAPDEGLSTAWLHPAQIVAGDLGIGIMFAIASFIGFEATAVFRSEARDPDRTVPRATYAALILVGVFYTVSSWAVVSAWGDGEAVRQATADPENMLLTTIRRVLGTAAADIADALLVTSIFAAILAFHNVLARYFFALGNSGALPEPLGRSHPRHGSPHIASITQTTTSIVLVVGFALSRLNPVTQVYAWMAGTATLGVLALMALTCAAVIVFFRRTRVDTRPWHTLAAPLAGLAGLLFCLWLTVTNFAVLIGGSPALAIGIGAVLVAAFVAGAIWSRRTSS